MGRLLLVAMALAGVACSRTLDPCGEGTYRQDSRCVAISVDASSLPGNDPDATLPHALDAATPKRDSATGMDSSAITADAAPAHEAAVHAGDTGSTEAGSDADLADAGKGAICFALDVERWADFHLSEGLADVLLDCAGLKAACEPFDCSIEECLRMQVGVTSCDPCVAAEAACMRRSCRRACGVAGSDDSCRACLCTSGCTAQFGTCAGAALDVCTDCTSTTCIRTSTLSPELIMVIVDGLL